MHRPEGVHSLAASKIVLAHRDIDAPFRSEETRPPAGSPRGSRLAQLTFHAPTGRLPAGKSVGATRKGLRGDEGREADFVF